MNSNKPAGRSYEFLAFGGKSTERGNYMGTKKVQIVVREGWHIRTPLVEVVWECPTCGGPMGEPKGRNWYEDGETYHCDVWENSCGHVARYKDLKIVEKGAITS
jgi:hypothetical protein